MFMKPKTVSRIAFVIAFIAVIISIVSVFVGKFSPTSLAILFCVIAIFSASITISAAIKRNDTHQEVFKEILEQAENFKRYAE